MGNPLVEEAGVDVVIPDNHGWAIEQHRIREHHERRDPRTTADWNRNPTTIIALDLTSGQAASFLRHVDQVGLPARLLLIGAFGTTTATGPDPAELAAAAIGTWGSRVVRLAMLL